MIFKVAYKKDDNYLVKIAGLAPDDTKGDKDGTWATCPAKVYNWAKKSYKEGDEVNAEYTQENGQYFVNRITKGSGSSKQTKKTTKKQSSNTYSKSPEDKEQIKRLSVLRASAEAVQIMAGQIGNIDDVASAIEVLYDRLYKKVSE